MKQVFLFSLLVIFMLTVFSCKKDTNYPPMMLDQIFTVKENSTPGLVCATINATDPENDLLTYSMEADSVNLPFVVNSKNGNVKIRLTANLDYELIQQYKFHVAVSDGSQSTSALMTINLTDQVEVPNVSDQTFDINENVEGSFSIGNVKFKSKGPNEEFSFKIVEGNASNLFFIGEKSGELFLAQGEKLNYEVEKSYPLVVKVQNLATPEQYAIITVGVNVVDVNEKPSTVDGYFTVFENIKTDTEIGSLITADVDAGQTLTYSIIQSSVPNSVLVDASSGKLTVMDKSKFDYETNNKIILSIKVTDNGTVPLSDTANVTINIKDLDETPTIYTEKLQVDENSALGTVVGKVIAESYTHGPLEYAIISGDPTGIFTINSNTGLISVAQSGALNYELKSSYSLKIQVKDIDNPSSTKIGDLTIDLKDINEQPVTTDAFFKMTNTDALGTVIGRVSASDPDNGQQLSYSIASGNSNGYFSINSSNGNILLAKSINMNSLPELSFVLTIRVKDNALNPLTAEANVAITVSKTTAP